MLDGFGIDYYRNSDMPNLKAIENNGQFKEVQSLMPSVTNLNNASICTEVLPEVHGITGNSFYNLKTLNEEFMEEDSLLLAPTLFEKAQKLGIKSMLFSSKKKTISLLSKGSEEAISPETASAEWSSKIGIPPSIYSSEVNFWLMKAAIYSMVHRPEVDLFYIHTTDYPMHTWAPESGESRSHLHEIDFFIGEIKKVLPEATILITADHSVHHKSFCWDLQKALKARKIDIKIALSPERDKYFKHHRGFGGCSFVYLKDPRDREIVKKKLMELKGVESVLTRPEASEKFHLMPSRIGDLMVLGDANTVFGDLDSESENLPPNYRSHGSLYETQVPVFAINPPSNQWIHTIHWNYEITQYLFPSN